MINTQPVGNLFHSKLKNPASIKVLRRSISRMCESHDKAFGWVKTKLPVCSLKHIGILFSFRRPYFSINDAVVSEWMHRLLKIVGQVFYTAEEQQ